LGYSPKKNFFLKIKTKNNKGWQRGESRPGNQVAIFRGDSRPSCAPIMPKIGGKKMQIQGQIK
jgi:hypothetical protein